MSVPGDERVNFLKLHLWLIKLIGVIVPRRLRVNWRQEWEAELRCREAMLAEWDRLDWRNKFDLLRRSASAFWDALWLQPKRLEEEMFQDLRFGARMLLKSKGFTAVAASALALGIGANTAIFSLIDAVLLRPMIYDRAEQLVMIWENADAGPAPGNYNDWNTQNQVFQGMAALAQRRFHLTGLGEPEQLTACGVTANFLPLLGVKPFLGRNFLPEEDRPGAAKVVLLSYSLWQSSFGGESSLIGSEIALNGEKHTVIGVLPRGFQFGEPYVRVWTPLGLSASELTSRDGPSLRVVARLKPGVTISEADADIKAITMRIAQQFPDAAAGLSSAVVSLREELTGKAQRPLLLLALAVAFVLLIACANLGGLLLARAAIRQREIAVRAALGAGRLRLLRQFLTESLLLAGGGGVLGALLAVGSFEFLQRLVPEELTLQIHLQLNWRVLLVNLLAALAAGLLFGLAPAWQASRVNLNQALKRGVAQSIFGGFGATRRLRNALVIGEVALALILLVGAALLIQTLYHLHSQYAALRPESLLTARTALPDYKYNERSQRTAFYANVLARVRALPGVVSAGYTTSVPLEWKGGASNLTIEGKQSQPDSIWNANHRQVTEDYLQTLGLPLLGGRYFNTLDHERSQMVAIINETMARKYWPGEDPLGKRFKIGEAESRRPWLTIVGVVADVRQEAMDAPAAPEMYLPQRQSYAYFAPRELVVRASVEPLTLAPAVRAAVHAVDPDQPVANLQTMQDILSGNSSMRRAVMLLWSVFAALALLLAALGLYGALSYFVTQHTPEIGVRMALGAQPRDVIRLVLRQGLRLVLGGGAAGCLGAFILTRLMKSLVFGVGAIDPLTFALAPLLLGVVALAACWIPARRATRVDPLVALSRE
ncbi:MAG TPA: ABC transporter permease [Blastocatellia bacterium]|nr:ABC transporter permease [Blastocatellia bacterium]